MTLTAAAKKIRAKRARRPIYLVVAKLIDPNTSEVVGALVPAHEVDQRLLRDRKFRVGREIRGELKQPRDGSQHRLIHKIGHLMIDNVEGWEQLDAHDAVKRLQLDADVCCETVEMDATPVIAAVLDACEALLGAGARKVLSRVLPEIRTIPVKRAESLSFDEMEQARFQELFDGLTEYIGRHYTRVMLDEVRAEFWEHGWAEQESGVMLSSIEQFAKRVPRLARQRHSSIKLRTNRCWRNDGSHLAGFIVHDSVVERQEVLQVAQALQCGCGSCQRSLNKVAGLAQFMQMEAPAVERGGFANYLDNLVDVFLVRIHHQDLSVAQLAEQSISKGHQVQGIGSRARRTVQGSLLAIVAGYSQRDGNGNSDRYQASHRLHPGRPIDICWRPGLRWMPTQQRPHQKAPSKKSHHSYDCPVSVGSSLRHVFPPSMDGILPLGVAA